MVLREENPEIRNSRSEGDRMRFFMATTILLHGLLAGQLTAAQVGKTSETRSDALTNKPVLNILRACQEVLIAKIKSSGCKLDTSPIEVKELKTTNLPGEGIMAMAQAPAARSSAPGLSNPPANTESRRMQNIAPEEMWNRVTWCVFPKYPALAFNSHITGTIDIGLGISPEGDVGNNSRVLDGPPLFAQSAMEAIRRWKFRPNIVQGKVTWSRVRVLVRFNTDGTTAVDLAPAILSDNFGDPGTPKLTAAAVPRPASAPECEPMNEPTQAPIFVNGAYKVGIGGIGFPRCIACPDPSYSDQARSAKISGIVVLHLIVTTEGHTANIQVQRSLGYGLDEEAVKAVGYWRFRPAVGLDGTPVPVWTDIEANFRIK
jgi:TonB family protein